MTRPLGLGLGIALLIGVVVVIEGGRSSSHHERARPVVRTAPAALSADVRRPAPESSRWAGAGDDADSDTAPMPSGLHVHPDPAIRLYALEAWALHPGPTLDPVTYALVDPDESVRARAQELFEEMLSRRKSMEPQG